MPTRLAVHLAIVLLLASSAGAADAPWAVGERVEGFSLEDQHGVLRAVDADTRLVLFSRDMEGGDVLKEALADAPDGFLEARGAAYVADISRMPGLVTRLFALPSMRRRPYPMLLDREGEVTARLPGADGRATLIFLDDLRVVRVLHVATSQELRQALGMTGDDASR
jgi:hypothetical protein